MVQFSLTLASSKSYPSPHATLGALGLRPKSKNAPNQKLAPQLFEIYKQTPEFCISHSIVSKAIYSR